MGGVCKVLVGATFVASFSWAVTLSVSGCGLGLESVSSTKTCVGWLTVADVRPGPLTLQVQVADSWSEGMRQKT